MGMDFGGLVRKRVWKMTFFGLKQGQDLENWTAHPYQKFSGVTPGWGGNVQRCCILLKGEHFSGCLF